MRWWPRSLTARILLVEVLAIAVVIVALPLLTVSLLHRTMREYQARELTTQARAIANGLELRGDTVRVHLPPSLAATYTTAYDGRAFALLDGKGRVVSASVPASTLPATRIPRRAASTRFDLPPLTGISLPVTVGPARLWVAVIQNQAEPGAILDDVVDAFLSRYVAVLVAVLALLPLVNSVLIRRLVRAVGRVSRRAASIGPYTLDTRLDGSDLPAEVVELVQATNNLLARLQHSFATQREFIGNVVHELRTPLAALKIQLDRVSDAQMRDALHGSLDRVSHVMSQIRNLAELEMLGAGRRHDFDLREIAREAIGELAPEIYAAGNSIDLATPDAAVLVTGEPTLARLALSNLVSNATRHTPAGTSISVSIDANGAVAVADTGPGIASEARSLVTRRFWRADQRRSDAAGLGLSIVRRIMEVHGGEFALEPGPGGGALFRLCFPLAARGLSLPARA